MNINVNPVILKYEISKKFSSALKEYFTLKQVKYPIILQYPLLSKNIPCYYLDVSINNIIHNLGFAENISEDDIYTAQQTILAEATINLYAYAYTIPEVETMLNYIYLILNIQPTQILDLENYSTNNEFFTFLNNSQGYVSILKGNIQIGNTQLENNLDGTKNQIYYNNLSIPIIYEAQLIYLEEVQYKTLDDISLFIKRSDTTESDYQTYEDELAGFYTSTIQKLQEDLNNPYLSPELRQFIEEELVKYQMLLEKRLLDLSKTPLETPSISLVSTDTITEKDSWLIVLLKKVLNLIQ